jgi:alkyl hydroperoxide reductase subunit AhpF
VVSDPIKDKLKSLNITDDAQVKEIKDYLQKVKEFKEAADKKDKDKEEKKPILKVEKTARA